jgi:glycosyltransferase involved in cell wall biosynthesis
MKISVLMVTYNHAPYIAKAIESVLAQENDFEIELIIGEDCSTDSTRSIVESYSQRFPSRIKAVLNEKNLGPAENFKSIYNCADCSYIAILEGDDYWTDPFKLKKQIEFLEQNSKFAISFHNVSVFNQENNYSYLFHAKGSMLSQYTIDNLLNGNFIQTCSVVYRRENLSSLPQWLQKLPIGDWPLHILHAEKGLIGYIDEFMAVYRILNSGSWANRPTTYRLEKSILTARMLNEFTNQRYSRKLGATSVRWSNDLIDCYTRENNRQKAFECMIELLDTIDDVSLHAPYATRYLSLFITSIAALVQEGKEADAFSLYSRNLDKLPYVKELQRLGSLMATLYLRYAGESATMR